MNSVQQYQFASSNNGSSSNGNANRSNGLSGNKLISSSSKQAQVQTSLRGRTESPSSRSSAYSNLNLMNRRQQVTPMPTSNNRIGSSNRLFQNDLYTQNKYTIAQPQQQSQNQTFARRTSFKTTLYEQDESVFDSSNKIKQQPQQQYLTKAYNHLNESDYLPDGIIINKPNKYLTTMTNLGENFNSLNLRPPPQAVSITEIVQQVESEALKLSRPGNDYKAYSNSNGGSGSSLLFSSSNRTQMNAGGSAMKNSGSISQFYPEISNNDSIVYSIPYKPKATSIIPSPSSTSSTSSSSSPPSFSSSSSSSAYNYSTNNNNNNNNNCSINNYNNFNLDNYANELDSRGIVGLKNLGNTCFMNSILQCLSNTKFLLEYCLRGGYINDLNTTLSVMKGSLFNSYASLIKTMWKNNGVISPSEFKSQIARFAPRFVGYAQQDAEEFLYYLLKGLHEDVNFVRVKPKPYVFDEKLWDRLSDAEKSEEHWTLNLRTDNSRISDMFVGQLKSTLKCTKCDYRSSTFELFWHLAVPLPNKSSSIKLDDCIKLFMAEEILDGDNKPTCSRCNEKRRCTKRYTIEKLPKILVIHLKRFLKVRYNNKINLNVDYPIDNLDMSKHLSHNVDPSSSTTLHYSNSNCLYDLYGISLHSGTESSGHYVAYCKHPYKKKWHSFNDSTVREISYNALQDSNAYILFYQLSS